MEEDQLTVCEVESFLRLGPHLYDTLRLLREGGLFVRDEALAAQVRRIAPGVPIKVKPWLPGALYAVDRGVWEAPDEEA